MLHKLKIFQNMAPEARKVVCNEFLAGLARRRGRWRSSEQALHESYRWFERAIAKTDGDGVPALYSLTAGYTAAYPETTGYIIPTLLHYSKLYRIEEAARQAMKLAEWLVDLQNDDGSMRAGYVDMGLPGCVFNTGMALFGFTAAWQRTQEERFRQASFRACQWLIESMDDDGCWRRNLSAYAEEREFHTYNVRVAWAMAEFGSAARNVEISSAAKRNLEWTLRQADADGFFQGCEMAGFAPGVLTHTIGYTLRGVLETSEILGVQEGIVTVRKAAMQLLKVQRASGGFAGLYRPGWIPASRFECLTGTAQLAIVLMRVHQICKVDECEVPFNRCVDWLTRNQIVAPNVSGVHGGIFGSFPIYGGYHPYSVPNWAVKFLMDALMLRLVQL